jgi:hypothetical protein
MIEIGSRRLLWWLLLAAIVFSSGPTTIAQDVIWKPAKVYSIEVGKSKLTELTHAIGKPKQLTDNDNTIVRGLLWYQYEVNWPAPGQLWALVDAKDKTVVQLQLKPKGSHLSEITKAFGREYRLKRYRRQMCEDGKGLTLCAEATGGILVFEYPDQGVVGFPGPNDTLGDVHFVSASGLGLLNCRCGEPFPTPR